MGVIEFVIVNYQYIIGFIVSIGSLAGAISAIIVFFRKYIKPVYEKYSEMPGQVKQVLGYVGPNGGKSLYDKVVCVNTELKIINTRNAIINSNFELGEFQCDKDGNIIHVNDVICRLTSRPELDFIGSNWIHTVAEEDREDVHEEWIDSIKYKYDFKKTYRLLTNSNQTILASTVRKAIYDNNGELLGYLGSVMPIQDPNKQ